MRRPNIYTGHYDYDRGDPSGYSGGEMKSDGQNIGAAAGGSELAVRMFEVAPRSSLCPYHYEYAEEWLLLISGELELRTPEGTETLAPGTVACFPAGPEGAHKVTATGDAPARFMMWSRRASPEVVVYADTDKIAVYTDRRDDHFRFYRRDAQVPYYEGEV